MLFEEIRRRRADPHGADGDDIFSLLLAARDEEGEPLSDRELRDELMTLLVAGHETTATALAWVLERLTRAPGCSRGCSRARSGDDAYLDAVLKETLRLRPVVPAVVRRLQAPMSIGGWQLPGRRPHRAVDLPAAPPPRSLPEPAPPSGPSASSATTRPAPTSGSRSAAACAAASGRASRCSRCGSVMQAILDRAELRAAPGAAPERTTRRAITLAPTRGGRIALG